MEEFDPRRIVFFKRCSVCLSYLIILIGALVIAGWTFDLNGLKTVFPGFVPMTPATACNLLLLGSALSLLSRPDQQHGRGRLPAFLALVVWCWAFVTFNEYIFAVDLGIDRILFPAKVAALQAFPGRMSPNATVCFLLSSASVLLFSLYKERTRAAYSYMYLQGIIALLAAVGYAYGVGALYAFSAYKPMALHTAVAFLLIFLNAIILRPETGPMRMAVSRTEGGSSMRRMMPVVLIVPFILGWLILEGWRRELFQIPFGLSMLIVLIIIVFAGVVWSNSLMLHRTDLSRLLAQRNLKEKEAFTQRLLQNSTAPTFVIDTNHRILIWNNACEKLTGMAASKLIGTSDHWKAFYDERRPLLADILLDGECSRLCKFYSMFGKSSILPEGWHSEGWFSKLGGRRRYVVFEAAPICGTSGELLAVVETIQDITDRVVAEESLHESEQRFRDLIQNIPVGLYRCTPGMDGRFIMANPAMARMFKYDSVLEMAQTGIERLYADEESGQALSLHLKSSGSLIGEEIRFQRRDGSFFWGAVTARLITSASGSGMFYDGMIEDVTERKRIEEMKSDFVALVSHQLKTPVGQIKGYIFNMLAGITGELNPKQRQYLEDMQEVSNRNYRLISDLLSLSRIERGVIGVDLRPIDLKEIVDAALNEYYKAVAEKGLVLNLQGAEDEIVVLADKEKFIEAICNVINNAVKFTEKGSIYVRIKSEDVFGIIEIEDTGPGMDGVAIQRLFRKDVALAGAPKAGGGSGLGLYIGKNFMLLQNGDITAESQPGKGMKFTFKIPLAQV